MQGRETPIRGYSSGDSTAVGCDLSGVHCVCGIYNIKIDGGLPNGASLGGFVAERRALRQAGTHSLKVRRDCQAAKVGGR
jgi:hypothetical protein